MSRFTSNTIASTPLIIENAFVVSLIALMALVQAAVAFRVFEHLAHGS